MSAFEFFNPKIDQFTRLTEVARNLLCILSSPAVFQGVFNVVRRTKTPCGDLRMSTLMDRLFLFGTNV